MPGPVERWLETFMCKQYADTFEAFGFKTLQSVCQLQLPQLQGMGVAQEHCEKILENVHVLRQTLLAGNNKTTSLTEQSPSTHESMANSASSVLRTVAMNANLHRGPMNHYRDDLSGHYGTNSNRILGSEYLGHDNSQMIGIPPNLPGYSVQNYGDHPQNHLMMSQQAGFSGHSAMYNQHSQSQQFMGQRFSSPYSTSPYNMASSGMSSMGGGTMYNSSPTQQGPSHNTVNRYLRHNPVCHSPQQVADNILQMASNYSSPQTVHVPLAKNRVAPYHIPPQYNMQQCNIPTQPQLRHTAKFCYPSSSPHQPTARTSPISPMHMHSPASHHSNQSLPNSSPVSLHSPAPPSVKSPVTTSSPSMASLRSPCAVQPITSPVGAGQQIRSPPHVSSSTGQSSNFQMYNTGIKSPQQQQSQSHFSPNPIGSPLSRAGSPYTPASKAQIHSPSQSQNYHHTPSSISPYISDASQDSCAGPTTLVVSNPLQSLQKLILLPETQVIDPKSVVNDACLPSPSHGNDGPKNCDSSSEHRNYSSLSCSNSNSCSSNCTDGKHCDSSGMDYSFKNSLEDTKDNFGMSCNMMNVADNLNNTKSVVVQHSLYTDSSCDKKSGLIPDEIKHEIKSPVEAQLSLCTQAKDQSRDAEVPVKGASCLSSTSVEQPLAKTDQLDDTADSNKEDKESSSPPSEQETSLVNGEVDVEMESTSAEEPKEIDSVECSGGLCSPPMQKSNNADGQEVEEKSIDSDRSSLLLPKSTDNQAQVTRRTSPRKRFGLFTLPMSFEEMDKKQTVQNSGTQTNVSKLKRSKRIQNNQVVQTKQRLHNEESDSDTSCGRLRVRKDSCSTYSRQSRNPLLRSQSKVYTGGGDDADAVYDETEHCTIELHERLGSSKCLSPEEVQDSPQTEKESTENPITDKKQKSPTTENCSIRSEEENSSVSVSSLPSKQKRRTSNRILHPNKKYTQDISQESPSRTKSFSNNEEEKKNPERTKSLSNLTDHGNGTSITSGKAVNLPKNRKGQFEVITISNSSVEDESDDTKIKVAASSELDDNARKRTRKRKLTPSNTSINTSDPGVEENTSSSKEKKASKVLEIKMPNKRKQDIDIVEIDLTEDVRSEDNCNNSDGTDDEPLSKMQDFAESSPPPSDMPMEEFTPPELRAIEEEVTSDSMNKKSPKSPVTNKRKKKGRSVGKARLKGSRLNRIRSDVYDFHSDNDSLKTLKLKKTLDLMANNKRKKTEVAVTSGPFVRVTTAKDEPALCIIFNQHQEDLDLKQKKKKTLSSSSSVQISNLPSEKSVLIPRSTLLGDTWVCALCGKGSTYKFLGDLFGPYYPEGSLPILKTEKLEDFSKQDSKQKKKRTLFPADQSKNADKPQTQTRKPSEEEKGTSDLDKKMLDSSSDVSEVWVHEDCVVWSDGVYLIGTKLYGLEEAAKVALATTCSICKERGAMVGCLHKGCIQKYHYICAAEKGCYLDEENFSLLCPKHKDKKVKVVESPSTAKS